MPSVLEGNHFFIAPFAIDGELMGVGECHLSDLSLRWLRFCGDLLVLGESFQTALPVPIEHLALRFTSAAGAALASIQVNGHLALSAVYLRGDNLDAEQELVTMFVGSLRHSAVVQNCQGRRTPFETVYGLNQRPLHVVVPWADSQIGDQDHNLVRELGNHLAAAFLCQPLPSSVANGQSIG